jgi:membrane protease YdiL (CAAX protease family)
MPFDSNESEVSGKEIILTYAVFFMPGLLSQGQARGNEYNSLEYTLLGLLMTIPQILLLFHLVKNIGRRGPLVHAWLHPRPASLLPALLIAIGILPFLIGLESLRLGLSWLVPESPSLRWSYNNYSLLPLTSLACLINAYREEFYFRAYLLEGLTAQGLGAAPAIGLAALMFGCGHLYQGWWGALFASLLGLYFGIIYTHLRDVHALAWAHAAYNLAILLASGILFQ